MSGDQMVRFLRDRLLEDVMAAETASAWPDIPRRIWSTVRRNPRDTIVTICAAPLAGITPEPRVDGVAPYLHIRFADHISRNDPDSVQRRVEPIVALLDRFEADAADPDAAGRREGMFLALRALADGYRTHPDWRNDWALHSSPATTRG
jgi:hypothetical protein